MMDSLNITLTILVSGLFLAGFAFAIIKFFCENTDLAKRNQFFESAELVSENNASNTPYAKIVLFSVGIRLLFAAAGFLICLIFQSDKEFNINAFSTLWQKWDSRHYISIAQTAYAYLENGENILLVFFPLYSLCMRLVANVISNYYVSGLIVSWGFYVGAMIYVYKLAALEFSDKTAWKTIILMSVFPFSFFFGSIHTESVCLFMMAATLYYIRQHKWVRVCIFGILAALSRMVGSLVAVAAVIEYIRVYRPIQTLKAKEYKTFWKDIYTKFIFIMLISLGGLTYLAINYVVSGNPFDFLIHQKNVWHNTSQFFPKTILTCFQYMFGTLKSTTGCIWIPEILLFVLVGIFMVMRWKRLPSAYGIFLGSYVMLSYAASWLLSGGRYISIAFPLFMLIADWTEEKESRFTITTIIFTLLAGIYLMAFLLSKQVM